MSESAPNLRDRCPECLGLFNVRPGVWRVVAGEIRCAYRCPACGHVWAASWALGVLDSGLGGAA